MYIYKKYRCMCLMMQPEIWSGSPLHKNHRSPRSNTEFPI